MKRFLPSTHRLSALPFVALLWMFIAVLSPAQAQQFMVQPGLNALHFAEGNLFAIQFFPNANPNEPVAMEAQLSLNGKVVARQRGVTEPGSNSVQVLSGDWPEPFRSMTRMGMMPVGSYSLCVSPAGSPSQCQSFVVSARSNAAHLNLIAPAKGSVIDYPFPLLSWVSTFQTLTEGVTFRLVMSERAGLKRSNLFRTRAATNLLDVDGISETNLTYPVEAPPLKAGVEYVWGVEAYADGLLLAQSDVWSFSLREPVELNELPISQSYIDISRINDLPHYYILGTLKLRYQPQRSNETAQVTIVDENGKKRKLKQDEMVFAANNPYMVYDLENLAGLKHLKKYTVELKLTSGLKKRFEITYVNPAFYEN